MFYYIARFILGLYYRVFFRLKTEGHENFPKSGGVVVCCNHPTVHEPMVLAIATKRKIHFMGKKELFENKLFAPVMNGLEGIPVDRNGTDLTAYKTSINYLKAGEAVGIFLQGRRTSELDSTTAKTGAALFALKSGACIMPVYITANYKWFSKIIVKYGAPMSLEKYREMKFKTELLEEITDELISCMNELKVV